MNTPLKIALVGYGRLARHLVPALIQLRGTTINQWFVRNTSMHKFIKNKFGVQCVSNAHHLTDASDILFLLVPDGAIEIVSNQLKLENTAVCHVSGMTELDSIQQPNRGKFYPLNTFNGKTDFWYKETPIFLQANKVEVLDAMRFIARSLGNPVHEIDGELLQAVHLAAVVSQNFSNYFIAEGERILQDAGLDRELIQPLLNSMIENLQSSPAIYNQTGPAIRNDKNTISKQLSMLEDNNALQNLYKLITTNIQSTDKS